MGILDFLFPKRCVSCRSFGSYLCRECLAKLWSTEGMICPMCERASFDGKTHPGCRTRYCLDGLVSAFRYEGAMKAVIHRLKYKPWIKDLIPPLMVTILDSMMSNKSGWFSGFVLVPVPLHPSRERSRGFNQAAEIGRAIARELGLKFKGGILKRIRKTKPQAELKGKERRENIKNAFATNPNSQFLIHDSKILLVDDVWTTGSTLRDCANVLKRAGAKEVWAMTLTR